MNQNNALDYKLLPIINITYACLLYKVIDQRRRAGKTWKQKEISSEIHICVRKLQQFLSGEKLPDADERNILARVLECGQLRDLPPQIETAQGVRLRFKNESQGIEGFIEHRGRHLGEILQIETGFERAQDQITRSHYDWEGHRLLVPYHHPDLEVQKQLYWRQKARIDYFACWAPYLGIPEFRDRPSSHVTNHRQLLRVCRLGTKDDIMDVLSRHLDLSLANAVLLDEFYKEKTPSSSSKMGRNPIG